MKYHDNTSFASDSIGIDIDLKKLKFLILIKVSKLKKQTGLMFMV